MLNLCLVITLNSTVIWFLDSTKFRGSYCFGTYGIQRTKHFYWFVLNCWSLLNLDHICVCTFFGSLGAKCIILLWIFIGSLWCYCYCCVVAYDVIHQIWCFANVIHRAQRSNIGCNCHISPISPPHTLLRPIFLNSVEWWNAIGERHTHQLFLRNIAACVLAFT